MRNWKTMKMDDDSVITVPNMLNRLWRDPDPRLTSVTWDFSGSVLVQILPWVATEETITPSSSPSLHHTPVTSNETMIRDKTASNQITDRVDSIPFADLISIFRGHQHCVNHHVTCLRINVGPKTDSSVLESATKSAMRLTMGDLSLSQHHTQIRKCKIVATDHDLYLPLWTCQHWHEFLINMMLPSFPSLSKLVCVGSPEEFKNPSLGMDIRTLSHLLRHSAHTLMSLSIQAMTMFVELARDVVGTNQEHEEDCIHCDGETIERQFHDLGMACARPDAILSHISMTRVAFGCRVTHLNGATTSLQRGSDGHERVTHYRPTMPDWTLSSRLVTALCRCPSLQQFTFQAARTFLGRLHLTLDAIHALFCHPTLVELQLEQIVIWGSGSGAAVAHCLRNAPIDTGLIQHHLKCVSHRTYKESNQVDQIRRTRLEKLSLHHCIVAADESILAGLDENHTITNLELTHTDLSSESSGLLRAMSVNQKLHSIDLSHSRLESAESSHHAQLVRLIRAIATHPTFHSLTLKGHFDYSPSENSRPISFVRHALEALLWTLRQNRQIQQISTDSVALDEIELDRFIQLHLGLNRAGYWSLCHVVNDATHWITAISIISNDVACIYHILQANPQLISQCSGQTMLRQNAM